MLAGVFEDETRAGDEVSYGLRDDDLRGSGERGDPCSDVDRDTADGTTIKFHFARVHARADLYPEVADRSADRLRTSDRTSGTVEDRQDAVARGVNEAASVTFDLHTSALIVTRRGWNAIRHRPQR